MEEVLTECNTHSQSFFIMAITEGERGKEATAVDDKPARKN
jgi:hypothetical protein